MFEGLDEVQVNILLASILGDGELTKLYKKSRRKNSSYREHYGKNQKEYREWKAEKMSGLFYITPNSHTLRSASSPFFTNLYNLFYINGSKVIPELVYSYCKLPHFLAVLYMDDGSLSITPRINHRTKKVYLTPQIYLYLQSFKTEDLILLKQHVKEIFNIELKLAKRNDGYGTILRTTSVDQTFAFLNKIKKISLDCTSMWYKTNWEYRLENEREKWRNIHPGYNVVITSSERNKKYTQQEIEMLMELKNLGLTDQKISEIMSRSYWSVVYKLSELRRSNLLK